MRKSKIFLAVAAIIFCGAQYLAAEVVSSHPRIWITPEYAQVLQSRMKPATRQWDTLNAGYHGTKWLKNNFIEKNVTGSTENIVPLGLAYQATHDKNYAEAGIATMIAFLSKDRSPGRSFTKRSGLANSLKDIALGYDWLYDALDQKQKEFIVEEVNKYINILLNDYLSAPWHGHAIRNMLTIGMWGYTSYGDNPRAEEFIRHARDKRFNKLLEGIEELFGKGGGLPADIFYGFGAEILGYAEMVYTATGEDIYESSSWFKDRMKFLLLSDYPGIFYDNNRSGYGETKYDGTYGAPGKIPYVGYMIYEDGHRGRSTIADNIRTQKLILTHHYKNDPIAKQLQYTITKKFVDRMCNPETGKAWQEFLWFDPNQDEEVPVPLSHYAAGKGIVLMRSDWTDNATWIFFKCGDMFSTSHQHWDQNSFSIFKKGDLAIKSGLYDGDGTAWHAVNYYSRTVGSNNILVYDPDEVFMSWRGVHYPNLLTDGGQKAYREKNEFADVNDWKKYSDLNDTGNILHYEDTSYYTYVCGDATNAYNNPRYCTPKVILKKIPAKNNPKIDHFTREFVFLRPDYIVIFDRVNSTNASYKKKWLLHFLNKPSVSSFEKQETGDNLNGGVVYTGADTTIASAGDGKLEVKTLLPEKRQIRLVGGRGYQDYWVFGKNAKPHKNMSRWQNNYGEWRIEIEPAAPAKKDIFLNVLYPCDLKDGNLPQSVLIESADKKMTGAHIKGESNLSDWAIMFGKDIKVETNEVDYNIANSEPLKHLICNLKPNVRYEIRQNGQSLETKQSSDQGLLFFESKSNNATDNFSIKTKKE